MFLDLMTGQTDPHALYMVVGFLKKWFKKKKLLVKNRPDRNLWSPLGFFFLTAIYACGFKKYVCVLFGCLLLQTLAVGLLLRQVKALPR